MFHIRCPLGHALEIEPEHFGQHLMCPLCQAVVYSSPPRPGERPSAKYEVQCSHGHILRVKEKYLGKEVACPSCQEQVSMKVSNLLAFSGMTLGVSASDLVAKYKQEQKAKRAKAAATIQPQNVAPPNTMTAPPGRLPAPPPISTTEMASIGKGKPMPAHLASDQFEMAPPTQGVRGPASADDFELEIVDTQFRIDIEKPVSPSLANRKRPEQQFTAGRIPAPPSPPLVSDSRDEGTVELKALPEQAPPPQPPAGNQVHLNCPNGHVLAIEKQYLGQKIQCPLCHTIIETAPLPAEQNIPTTQLAETIQIPCPNGHLLEVDKEFAGMQVQCPLCQAIVVAPPPG